MNIVIKSIEIFRVISYTFIVKRTLLKNISKMFTCINLTIWVGCLYRTTVNSCRLEVLCAYLAIQLSYHLLSKFPVSNKMYESCEKRKFN